MISRCIVDNLDHKPTYRQKYVKSMRKQNEHLRIYLFFPRPTLKYCFVILFFFDRNDQKSR